MVEKIPDISLLEAGYAKSETGIYIPKGEIAQPERPNRLMRRQLEKRARRYKKYQAELATKQRRK